MRHSALAVRLSMLLVMLVSIVRAGGAQEREVTAIDINGIISPATASYVERAIELSADRGAEFLLVRMDTPGGLLDATQDIVQDFLASPVPIVVYVTPQGASAASAGAFITLAAHVAAMAPATNIGAATPVQMGGGEADPDAPATEKMISYAESYIESIADERDRNVEWARSAVREGASISAEEAVQINVIDFIASDVSQLLSTLDGWEVDGRALTTDGVEIREIPMSAVERFFQTLFRPELIFLLMLVAIYGIIGELGNPGAIFPGAVGVVALLLLLYTIAILPLNLIGFAIVGVGIALLIAEAFVPSFGVLTIAGLAAFILGSLMIFEGTPPAFELSLAVLIPAALITAAFF
ncbi:MAG: NfeD family protein, partial [Bacteroidota bacterium]